MIEAGSFVKKKVADQVVESLKKSITNGGFEYNSDFPSSRFLARRYGVSHNVMLKALSQLKDENLIYLSSKRQGYKLVHQD